MSNDRYGPPDDQFDYDEEYEDDPQFDTQLGRNQLPPQERAGRAYDSETLLRRAIDIISTARTIPLSASPMINRDEIIELLEEAVNRLPDELRQARWMLKEKADFVARTRREADEILDQARGEAERMVQRTEVVRAAEHRARQVREAAESESRHMKNVTEDFLDQRLGSFEVLVDRIQRQIHQGREKLSIGAQQVEAEQTGSHRIAQDELARGFFDQDRG